MSYACRDNECTINDSSRCLRILLGCVEPALSLLGMCRSPLRSPLLLLRSLLLPLLLWLLLLLWVGTLMPTMPRPPTSVTNTCKLSL